MNDTDPRILAKMREMIQKKTPAQRLVMGCSMYDFSKQLVINFIFREKPDISPSDLRRELFLRFYGDLLDPNKQEKIIAHLNRVSQN